MNKRIMNLTRAVLLGLVVSTPINISAQNLSADQAFQQGSSLIRQNNIHQGLNLLRDAAAKGHPQAAFELGSLYESGLAVPKDYNQAKAFYESAIIQGHRNAHFNLALLLTNEQVPFSNLQQARNIMEVIAQQGDVEAQFVLATLMENTLRNVGAQPAKAIHWLGQAANQGHSKAQFKLGMYYLKGQSVARSPQTAFNWFNKAAQQGVAGAQFNLAMMYEKGDGIAPNLNTALRWYESAANLGNANAQQNLGIKYLLGEQVPEHTHKALDLITRAAGSGLRNSQLLLGQLYQSGYEGKIIVDMAKAEQWYLRAAKQGVADAQYQLALILRNKHNQAGAANFWIQQAAAAGHQDAIRLRADL